MANINLTLQGYIDRAWKRVSRDPDSGFATNQQITQIINEARREAWNALLDIDDGWGIATPFNITTLQGTTLYALPGDFRKVIGVRQGASSSPIGTLLQMNKRIVELQDTPSYFTALSEYAIAGDNIKILASADGTVVMDYLKDLNEYEYTAEVLDPDTGEITTYGITTPEPDLPRYAQDVVNAYVSREMMAIEGSTTWYNMWDKRLDKAVDEMIRNSQRHMQPTVIRSSTDYSYGDTI